MKKLLGLSLLAMLFNGCNGSRQRMPVYVHPFYDSSPFMVQFTPFAKELTADTKSEMKAFMDRVAANPDDFDMITLAILPIRLYDLGMKDEASYWFYTFAFRRNVFRDMLANRSSHWEYIQALDNFKQLSGQWINPYSFGDIDKLLNTLEVVIENNRGMKNPSHFYGQYESGYEFFDDEEKLAAAIEEQIEGVRGLMEYADGNREEIKQARKESGVEGKY